MPFSRTKVSFPDSNVIDDRAIFINAEPSMNRTLRGITIDFGHEFKNGRYSIRVNCESDSNVIDESELQCEKHSDPRISTFLGIKID
jgi:hypothetical protein